MRAARALAAAGTVVALAAGCGSETPPAADDVPALADALVRVETTVAEERYPAARSALEALVEDTTAARQAGDLSGDQAEAVLAAADALLEALPGQDPEPEEETPAPEESEPEPAPLEQSPLTTVPAPETTDDSDSEEDSDGDDEKPGKGEKPEKPEKDDKPEKDEKDDDD